MFDDLDPQEFEDTARTVIESCAQAPSAAERGKLLAEAGLLGVIAPEDVGGLGLSTRFAAPILRAAGEGCLAYPLIETLLLSKALADTDAELAARICSGETVATIAWLGTDAGADLGGAPMGCQAEHVLIFSADGTAVLAPIANAVRAVETHSFDIDVPEAEIHVSGAFKGVELDLATVEKLRSDARMLRAAFIHGAAANCLKMASDYAQDREQFGKLLSANQALRHRLSRDALVLETMRNAIIRAQSVRDDDVEMARNAAWLCSAQSGPAIAESAIQVFGGMGFTWEVPLHRHLRQMRAQARYGGAALELDQLGDAIIAGTANPWYAEIADAA
ncbi:acyl-CoA dehydrogenase family protein [Martelella mediterranea]|uniref:Acyl-CoA dehydrogenase, short-chain specific n=1 Tax=Martelella mediterranea DSM 17316 TaxID=1122214 RepID=A0A1U9Z5U3_9HYPH|nr:acyl-CoA dehydrogenase family protein [Martelella mediterranea]AQZ53034.1 Acyl-CoA dehydrogenase, short-chain specific [Martelella mediterranea DSM 17316]